MAAGTGWLGQGSRAEKSVRARVCSKPTSPDRLWCQETPSWDLRCERAVCEHVRGLLGALRDLVFGRHSAALGHRWLQMWLCDL